MAIPDEDKEKVRSFFKAAFAIDGDVDFIEGNAVRELVATHTINVMRLQDSKRGTFYVGTFKPK